MDTVLRKFGVNREEQQKLIELGMLSRNDRGNIYDKSEIASCFQFAINVGVQWLWRAGINR